MFNKKQREIDRLKRWKAEAMIVLNDWEKVWDAAGHPGRLGDRKSEAVAEEIHRLQGEVKSLRWWYDIYRSDLDERDGQVDRVVPGERSGVFPDLRDH